MEMHGIVCSPLLTMQVPMFHGKSSCSLVSERDLFTACLTGNVPIFIFVFRRLAGGRASCGIGSGRGILLGVLAGGLLDLAFLRDTERKQIA